MPVVIYDRDRWHARAPRPMSRQGAPSEAFIHHSDEPNAERLVTLAKQSEHMRAIQNFHMGPERGWSDIGYHYVVFQPYGKLNRARIFEGRKVGFVPAAQLGHNTGTLAICVVGNLEHDTLKQATRDAIEQLLKIFPSVHTLGGHRDVTPTSCPGKHGYAAVPELAHAAGIKTYHH
jgi:hypothetical protein